MLLHIDVLILGTRSCKINVTDEIIFENFQIFTLLKTSHSELGTSILSAMYMYTEIAIVFFYMIKWKNIFEGRDSSRRDLTCIAVSCWAVKLASNECIFNTFCNTFGTFNTVEHIYENPVSLKCDFMC